MGDASPEEYSREAEHAAIPDAYRRAQLQNAQILRARLDSAQLIVLPNLGTGQNLCALTALLQLAGYPPEDAFERAALQLFVLESRDDALGQALRARQGVHAEPETFRPLAENAFGEAGLPPLAVMAVGANGDALFFDPMRPADAQGIDPSSLPDDTALLFDAAGHYEAVLNRSGQPWSSVLPSLQAASAQQGPELLDDGWLIGLYLSNSEFKRSTAHSHARQLEAFVNWVQAQTRDNGPVLDPLCRQQMQPGSGPLVDHPQVVAYRNAVGVESDPGKHIAASLRALMSGGAWRAIHPADERLISDFLKSSPGNALTAELHAKWLRKIAPWLRDHPVDGCGSLAELVAQLNPATGEAARRHPRVADFRREIGPRTGAGKGIGGALDALAAACTTGHLRPLDEDAEKLVSDYVVGAGRDEAAAQNHAWQLRALSLWLHDGYAEARPTLSELRTRLAQQSMPARHDPDVVAFQAAHVGETVLTEGIADALDAFVRAGMPEPVLEVHPDDEEILSAYLPGVFRHATPANVLTHTSQLRVFANWLRDHSEEGRPSLGELQSRLFQEGSRAVDDPHVIAFGETVANLPKLRYGISSALDALIKVHSIPPQDRYLIEAYEIVSQSSPQIKKGNASRLRALASWLHQHAAEGRPSLSEIWNQLQDGGRANKNQHIID